VLLKNEGLLPLNLNKKPVIAVIGQNATQTMATGGLGAGIKALYEVVPLQGLKDRIGDKAEIRYADGYQPVTFSYADMFRKRTEEEKAKEAKVKEELAEQLLKEAVELASKADIVIFIGGNNRNVETEGRDRTDIMLPSGQDKLLTKIAEVNKNIITVLTSGAPNDLNVVKPLSKSIVISWFNGSEGGNALADVLLGNISPGGRLPFTIPVKLEDSPAYALKNYPQGEVGADVFANLVEKKDSETKDSKNAPKNDPNTAYYSEGSLVGYRWFETKEKPVMYPFGYGLSYSTFEYSKLTSDKDKYSATDVIKVTFELKNTGMVKADEVPQLYVHRVKTKVEWPAKELKAFTRVTLNPGESKVVTLEIPIKDLMYWNVKKHTWTLDKSKIELMLGSSVSHIKFKKLVEVK